MKKLDVKISNQEQSATVTKFAWIKEFNETVERGASEQYLTSLEKTVKFEIREINKQLGLLPDSDMSLLNTKWK